VIDFGRWAGVIQRDAHRPDQADGRVQSQVTGAVVTDDGDPFSRQDAEGGKRPGGCQDLTPYFTGAALDQPETTLTVGFNCYFPMPFYKSAKIDVQHEGCEGPLILYFYIDYEIHDRFPDGLGTFHAQWRRENPCAAVQLPNEQNVDGKENYVVLEAEGHGHYVGCHVDIDALSPGWWGEGDDMFFIDGEQWPPAIHGTGTEDYFCGAWNYNEIKEPFWTPYYGYHLKGNDDYTGKHSMYRYHIEDPIAFHRDLVHWLEKRAGKGRYTFP